MDLGWVLPSEGGVGRVGRLVLVERMPCFACVRWPFDVSLQLVQYLEALTNVRPGQVDKLPALMAAIQVDLTGNPAAARR